jgi:hypothetical protein
VTAPTKKPAAVNPDAHRKLDRKKPYGEIWGRDDSIPAGAQYDQNGMYFDQQGNYLGGVYKPADKDDIANDLANQNAQLAAENAELRRQLGIVPAAVTGVVLQQADKPEDPAPEELDREAIIAQLKSTGATFPKNASTKQLHAMLLAERDSKAE